MTTLLPNFRAFGHNLGRALGLVFDPVKDRNKLPIVQTDVQTPTPTVRTAKTDGTNVHEDSTGKQYARTIETDQYGQTIYAFDSTCVQTKTNVPAKLTSYDYYVFQKYRALEKYKFFDLDKYRIIKERAFSKAENNKPISAKSAAVIPAIQNLSGCGERRCKDYYKAMAEAHRMYTKKSPIPQREGLRV